MVIEKVGRAGLRCVLLDMNLPTSMKLRLRKTVLSFNFHAIYRISSYLSAAFIAETVQMAKGHFVIRTRNSDTENLLCCDMFTTSGSLSAKPMINTANKLC